LKSELPKRETDCVHVGGAKYNGDISDLFVRLMLSVKFHDVLYDPSIPSSNQQTMQRSGVFPQPQPGSMSDDFVSQLRKQRQKPKQAPEEDNDKDVSDWQAEKTRAKFGAHHVDVYSGDRGRDSELLFLGLRSLDFLQRGRKAVASRHPISTILPQAGRIDIGQCLTKPARSKETRRCGSSDRS